MKSACNVGLWTMIGEIGAGCVGLPLLRIHPGCLYPGDAMSPEGLGIRYPTRMAVQMYLGLQGASPSFRRSPLMKVPQHPDVPLVERSPDLSQKVFVGERHPRVRGELG